MHGTITIVASPNGGRLYGSPDVWIDATWGFMARPNLWFVLTDSESDEVEAAAGVFSPGENMELEFDDAPNTAARLYDAVKCTHCGEADRTKGDHGIGRCVSMF